VNREGREGREGLYESGSEIKPSLHDSHKEPENTVAESSGAARLFEARRTAGKAKG
jgi:hypothetical protein